MGQPKNFPFPPNVKQSRTDANINGKVGKVELLSGTGDEFVGVQKTGGVLRTQGDINEERTSSLDFTSIGAAAASFGVDTPAYISGAVYIPNGTHPVDFVAGQATKFMGQSRGATVLQGQSGGLASIIDARYTRGSSTTNTWGGMRVEDLTVNGNSQSREGICLYGGGCGLSNVTVENCVGVGVRLEYVLKCRVNTVTSQNNSGSGFVGSVDAVHGADVNTSINTAAVWSLSNGGWGFELDQAHYCTLTGITTQGNANGGFRLDGTGSSVNANVSLIGCASESDTGPAVHATNLRDFFIANFFLLADPANNSFVFNNCSGTVVGLTDTTVHTGGTYTISIVNPVGPGRIVFIGGQITIDPAQMVHCTFIATVVNGNLITSVGALSATSIASTGNITSQGDLIATGISESSRVYLIDANSVQNFYLDTTALGSDYSGMGIYDNNGLRVAAFRRFAGGVILSSGSVIASDALNNGDLIFEIGTTTATLRAKGTDGVVRTGTITLA